MAQRGMPRIARRLGSVCQDTGRPRSDHADHGARRTMAQRCSAPATVVEGVSHQSARKKGLPPAPSRVDTGVATDLSPSPTSRFPAACSLPVLPASFFLKNWHPPSRPFHFPQNFLLICSDTTDPASTEVRVRARQTASLQAPRRSSAGLLFFRVSRVF